MGTAGASPQSFGALSLSIIAVTIGGWNSLPDSVDRTLWTAHVRHRSSLVADVGLGERPLMVLLCIALGHTVPDATKHNHLIRLVIFVCL